VAIFFKTKLDKRTQPYFRWDVISFHELSDFEIRGQHHTYFAARKN